MSDFEVGHDLTRNHTVIHAGDRRADGAISVRRRPVVSTVAGEGGVIVRVARKLTGRQNRLFISLCHRRLVLKDGKKVGMNSRPR